MSSRFLIGIDLGTTNSAVAYVDTQGGDTRVRIFEVLQLVAPGEVAPRRQLPSFVYLAGEHDLASSQTVLPWRKDETVERVVVGELARGQGARMPSRMVASAKSWLCHPGVDRQAAILPWGETDGPKRSPVQAQAAVLGHIRDAWDHAHPDARLVDQELVVTVPASFDEAARELTLQAAREAGFPPVVLLEEPQAAFYAWIDQHPGAARSLKPDDRVLVFDVGGGTTDFTLIAVDADGDGFARTAVGDHLLLGGDNLDLTLAKIVEQRLTAVAAKGAEAPMSDDGFPRAQPARRLDALQWHGLVHACRLAKEQILTEGGPDSVPITVASRGAKLLGGTLRDDVTREELGRALFDGFFPVVERDATPQRARSGLQEFGLPYAADPAVTRHLAAFLHRHDAERVDAVLFNGGAMTPPSLRARVLEVIARWQGTPARELEAVLPEMAVAQGAAYYGLVRRGLAARIKGGTPRAYYVGVEAEAGEKLAVCVAGKGLDDGAQVTLDRDFVLLTNRPVRFALFSSTTRTDEPGDVVVTGDGLADMTDDDSDLLELPPLVTVLRARGRREVTVRLEVRVTELGALEIHAIDRSADAALRGVGTLPASPVGRGAEAPRGIDKWRLSFDLRSGGATTAAEDAAAAQPHPRADEAKLRVTSAFRGTGNDLASLAKDLEAMLEARRDEWSMLTARAIFDALDDAADTRKRSQEHEQRWLNLAGFCLRPGTGAPLDTWRARKMWGVFNEGLAFPRSETSRLAWWITWRRIAGGLAKGQQDQIYDRLHALLFPGAKQLKKLAEVKPSKQELGEIWRCVASMERLALGTKIKLGDELMRRLAEPKGRDDSLHVWAIGRIGARLPLYGPANLVVPPSKAGEWLRQLLDWSWPEPEKAAFPLAQLGRRTGDRARDLDDGVRARLAAVLRTMPGGDRTAILVEQVVALEAREERVALGDTLPAGLRLVPEPEIVIEMEAD